MPRCHFAGRRREYNNSLTIRPRIRPGTVVQIGLPPRRIDPLTRITGVDFDTAWRRRVEQTLEGRPIPYLGRADLIANKRATGRAQDLVDASLLEAD